jgi:hypothetical protein
MVLLAICTMAAAERTGLIPDVLRAKSFEVINDQGIVMARVGQVDGNGGIALFGRDGKENFVVGMTPNGEQMWVRDANYGMVRLGGNNFQPTDLPDLIEYPDRGDTPD